VAVGGSLSDRRQMRPMRHTPVAFHSLVSALRAQARARDVGRCTADARSRRRLADCPSRRAPRVDSGEPTGTRGANRRQLRGSSSSSHNTADHRVLRRMRHPDPVNLGVLRALRRPTRVLAESGGRPTKGVLPSTPATHPAWWLGTDPPSCAGASGPHATATCDRKRPPGFVTSVGAAEADRRSLLHHLRHPRDWGWPRRLRGGSPVPGAARSARRDRYRASRRA
jgi:hypothetical protein